MSQHLISPEQLKEIKENCLLWSNNCGGCETCDQMFRNPPLYDHQETFYLICMIEERDKRIKELESGLFQKIYCILKCSLLALKQYSKKGRKYE